MTTATPTQARPTVVYGPPEEVTAGELDHHDFLLEVLPARGVRGTRIEKFVESNVEGPSFRGIALGDPVSLGRVRITLTSGAKLLLFVGQPVIVRHRVPTPPVPCQHLTRVDNEQDNGWTERCLDCGTRGI